MKKKIKKAVKPGRKPAKLPTILDATIRAAITDLLNRNQIDVLRNFTKKLGYNQSNQLTYFLNGERNYPKKKIERTIQILRDEYTMNEEFLRTGHGKMYVGKPYEANDITSFVMEDENFLSLGAKKNVIKLEETNKQLEQKINLLETMIKDKDELIELQKQLIKKTK